METEKGRERRWGREREAKQQQGLGANGAKTPPNQWAYGTLFLARRAGMELRRTGSMFALKILSET